MQDLNDKITGGTLTAAEWNELPSEIQNVFEAYGIVPSSLDLNQLGKALSNKAGTGDFFTDSGSANSYVLSSLSVNQDPTEYREGMRIRFATLNPNTDASTVNVTGLGAKDIVEFYGSTIPVAPGTIASLTTLYYDGTNFARHQESPTQYFNKMAAWVNNRSTVRLDDLVPVTPGALDTIAVSDTGTYVTVGTDAACLYSTDGGFTWIQATLPGVTPTHDLIGCEWGNGTFVVTGGQPASQVFTSPDGITWTQQSFSVGLNNAELGFGNGRFFAAGTTGLVETSTDGITWVQTANGSITTASFVECGFGNGIYFCLSGGAVINYIYSTDATNWIGGDHLMTQGATGHAYGNGIHILCGRDSSDAAVSWGVDGINWTLGYPPGNSTLRSEGALEIEFGDGVFLVTGTAQSERYLYITDNAVDNWEVFEDYNPITPGAMRGILYDGARFWFTTNDYLVRTVKKDF